MNLIFFIFQEKINIYKFLKANTNPSFSSQIRIIVSQIAKHIEIISERKLNIIRFNGYFKEGKNKKIYFLFANSIRLEKLENNCITKTQVHFL